MLADLLSLDVFRFFLVFTRLGAAMMLFPGLGGTLVSSRIRLLLALSVSFLILPSLAGVLPPVPRSVGGMLLAVFSEAVIGIFLGTVVSVIMSTLNMAGSMIGYQTGLTNAFSFDPIAQQQSQLLTGFLSNVGLLAVFSTDLHHLMFQAVAESYSLFPPGQSLPLGDFAETLGHLVTETFRVGTQFAAPLIVFGLVFYAGLGLLSRLVPQLQVFFVGLPVQVMVGMWMFMVTLPLVVSLFLRFFETALIPYLQPR
ncbi:MAG: flagellar type III secretion system protein FliR [Magnetospirillum sp.]|nr:flagellar type III secretion system protein FliR [Magnetospirillum sp.]